MKIILMMVMTADGFIAKTENHNSMEWSSKSDKQAFVKETREAGVVIMGSSTFATIGKPLKDRLTVVMTRATDQNSIPDSLKFTSTSPQELCDYLAQKGYEKAILCGGATINGLFLKAKLIDEIWLTIEPKLFGKGLTIFANTTVDLDLELLSYEKLSEQTLQLKYAVMY
jgi:dihydrofolate reductase